MGHAPFLIRFSLRPGRREGFARLRLSATSLTFIEKLTRFIEVTRIEVLGYAITKDASWCFKQPRINKMAAEISLVFLGGIADSGKSALMRELQVLTGVEAVRISDCLKKPLGVPEDKDNDKPLRAGVIYRDWKFEAEKKAINELGEKI